MSKKMWGGRFSKKIDPLAEEFTRSIQYDRKLAEYDLLGSMAHVQILKKSGYLSSAEAAKLTKGLESLLKRAKAGFLKPGDKDEDIHTFIQNELQKQAGGPALKLHTARSRNEQVVFATKLYCKAAVCELNSDIGKLIKAFSGVARKNAGIILPGFTHLQHAQPVCLKDYLGAYVEMLNRDSGRLDYVAKNIKLTLGAGALAGTPISASKYNVKVSGFNINPVVNSLDAVSDRDFVLEVIGALSILAVHLSRLSEDLIIWSTREFDFVQIHDSFCTGSSLMPQKKNPDVLELIRGYAARLCGNLISVLVMMKGLPLTYNRDMQLDKEPLFNSFGIISQEIRILQRLVKALKFNKAKIGEQLKDESLYATDLVYYLVGKKVPFKKAHDTVGKLVKYSIDNSIPIKEMPGNLLKKFSDRFVKEEILRLFDPAHSVRTKKSVRR
ncbi:MAG: argininosuccinate lyase [Candidatus Omnitrophota bacterium]